MARVVFVLFLLFGFGYFQRTPQSDRQFTFINSCAQDLYIGTQGHPLPAGGGFKLVAGQTLAYTIAGNTQAARFWARTGCSIGNDGHLHCQTGDCPLPPAGYSGNDGTHCYVASTGTQIGGIPPATIAEFTLGGGSNIPDFPDFYDLSLVDGFNLPIEILAMHGKDVGNAGPYSCGASACRSFDCSLVPPELQYKDSNGNVYACASICTAINNATQRSLYPSTLGHIWTATDPYKGYPMRDLVCCTCGEGKGACSSTSCEYGCSPYNIPTPIELGGKCNVSTWPLASNSQRYEVAFSSQCPTAYSWQFDDTQATFQCIYPDYQITFCPKTQNVMPQAGVSQQSLDSSQQSLESSQQSLGTSLQNPVSQQNSGTVSPAVVQQNPYKIVYSGGNIWSPSILFGLLMLINYLL